MSNRPGKVWLRRYVRKRRAEWVREMAKGHRRLEAYARRRAARELWPQ
jgi:hypothetical protein